MEMLELLPFICDDLHFDCKEVDGYDLPFNFIVCEREAGKSTLMWKKVYNAFRKENRPSIVIKRYQVDITDAYIDDTEELLNKFTKTNIKFTYAKGDIKQGMVDLKINGKIFVRIVALNTPMSRLKSMLVRGIKYFMMDEFIVNLRIGEKYLSDEPMRVKELYTTYNRETVELYPGKPIKCYFFGNPYSLFNPYFSWKNVNTNKLYPGAILKGPDFVIQCYKIRDELKEKILANNPLYQFDELYKQYAFDGRAIQDTNIRIIEEQPNNFKLYYCFKLHNKVLGVYRGYDDNLKLHYWCQILDLTKVSKRRDIICFDFGEMVNRTILASNNGKKLYSYLKESIEHRWIAYKSIEASYFMEEIYQEL